MFFCVSVSHYFELAYFELDLITVVINAYSKFVFIHGCMFV